MWPRHRSTRTIRSLSALQGFDDVEDSPAAGLSALVDATFMELLSIAHPTVHGPTNRRSAGFDAAAYSACAERLAAMLRQTRQLLADERGDEEAATREPPPPVTCSSKLAHLLALDLSLSRQAAHEPLPPPISGYLYMALLGCRFDHAPEEAASLPRCSLARSAAEARGLRATSYELQATSYKLQARS